MAGAGGLVAQASSACLVSRKDFTIVVFSASASAP
jgi:hypothetical protein